MRPERSAPGAVEPGAAFAEPWQARAFAIAILAARQGCFTWAEWSHALGRELRTRSRPESQSGEAHYFDCWLRTLQDLLIGKGAIGPAELRVCRDAWEDAYRRTPHGVPVVLSAARDS